MSLPTSMCITESAATGIIVIPTIPVQNNTAIKHITTTCINIQQIRFSHPSDMCEHIILLKGNLASKNVTQENCVCILEVEKLRYWYAVWHDSDSSIKIYCLDHLSALVDRFCYYNKTIPTMSIISAKY